MSFAALPSCPSFYLPGAGTKKEIARLQKLNAQLEAEEAETAAAAKRRRASLQSCRPKSILVKPILPPPKTLSTEALRAISSSPPLFRNQALRREAEAEVADAKKHEARASRAARAVAEKKSAGLKRRAEAMASAPVPAVQLVINIMPPSPPTPAAARPPPVSRRRHTTELGRLEPLYCRPRDFVCPAVPSVFTWKGKGKEKEKDVDGEVSTTTTVTTTTTTTAPAARSRKRIKKAPVSAVATAMEETPVDDVKEFANFCGPTQAPFCCWTNMTIGCNRTGGTQLNVGEVVTIVYYEGNGKKTETRKGLGRIERFIKDVAGGDLHQIRFRWLFERADVISTARTVSRQREDYWTKTGLPKIEQELRDVGFKVGDRALGADFAYASISAICHEKPAAAAVVTKFECGTTGKSGYKVWVPAAAAAAGACACGGGGGAGAAAAACRCYEIER